MLIIGITGQFCSGKSTAAKILARFHRATVIDADKIGHTALLDNKVKKRLIGCFGKGIIKNGAISRKSLAELAFANKESHKALCRITHPVLVDKILKKIRQIKVKNPKAIVIIDAAVLLEMGLLKYIDKLIAVKLNRKQQIKRAQDKWKLSKNQINKRMKLQIPASRFFKKADFIIDNSGSFQDLKNRIKAWERINGK